MPTIKFTIPFALFAHPDTPYGSSTIGTLNLATAREIDADEVRAVL